MAIDTRQARTDLFGIGKGAAQVFSEQQSDLMEREARRDRMAFLQSQQQQKAAEKKAAAEKKREDELLKTVAATKALSVKPGDVNYFKGKTDELYNTALELASKDGEISSADFLKINSMANSIVQEAQFSKAQMDQINATLATYQQGKHYDADRQDMINALNTEGGWTNQYTLPERVNWADAQPDLIKAANLFLQNPENRVSEVTEQDARDIIKNRMVNDPIMMHGTKREMQEKGLGDMSTITDQQAVEYRQTPEQISILTQRKVTPEPTAVASAARKALEKEPSATIVWDKYMGTTGTLVVDKSSLSSDKIFQHLVYKVPTEDGGLEEKTVYGTLGKVSIEKDPETGEQTVTGAKLIPSLTAGEKKANKDTEEKIEKAKRFVGEKPTKSMLDIGDKRYKKELKEWEARKQKVKDLEKELINAKPIDISAYDAMTILHNNYGYNVDAFKAGQPGSRKEQIISKEEDQVGPQEGDKKQFKEGPATFNGKKWVLDK